MNLINSLKNNNLTNSFRNKTNFNNYFFSVGDSLEQREFINNLSLTLKICFSLMAFVSLIKIGHNAKVRITRLEEIKESYIYESTKYINLSRNFDRLLSVTAEQRFMKDQDQIISRDIMRVIWR